MTKGIEESNIYKRIRQDDFIYKAIYSLESYVFEKDLLDEEDYKLMLKLRDPFDHLVIKETAEKVRKQIEEVLVEDSFFEAQVYFRPKKINKKTDKLQSRPIHSASLITLITSVVLLNTLLLEVGEDSETIELTELTRMLPANFYGNIPSERPEHLFKPWYYQFKAYTEVITNSYYEYARTKEYKYEVTLDLKNFFPSINPIIIYEEIINNYAIKYGDLDRCCLKAIVVKLLTFKISNLPSKEFKEMYYGLSDISFLGDEVWSRGIPQGLPHAYFFGNICMVKVAEIFQEVIVGENGKAYYYVDDSMIYTNNLGNPHDLTNKIVEVNEKLSSLGNRYKKEYDHYKKEAKGTSVESFFEILDKFKYEIKVHDMKSEKTGVLEIQNPKYGQANLNAYSKLASITSFDLNRVFSDTEEINLVKKLEAIYISVEKEIERINKMGEQEGNSNYKKVLVRFKKFFKYRQRRLELSRNDGIQVKDINELLLNFEVGEGKTNKEKFEPFFNAYDEDILANEFKFFFLNSPYFWESAKGVMEKFNIESYTDKYRWPEGEKELTISYFHKISMSLSRNKASQHKTSGVRYGSIKRIVQDNIWNMTKVSKGVRESNTRRDIDEFVSVLTEKELVKNHKDRYNAVSKIIKESGLVSQKVRWYRLINLKTNELFRIVMNTYFSEIMSVDTSDFKYLARKDNKPMYYNEARILLFLRNHKFNLESFHMKYKDYTNGEVLDYTLFEVIDYFGKFVQDPVYIDNLIMVHKYTCDIWKNGSKYLHFYTLHNQEHAVELIRSTILFMKSITYFQISKRDYYILFISCYLHDISMVLHPNLMESFIVENKASNIIYSEFKQRIKDILVDAKGDAIKVDYVEEQSIKKMLVDYFIKLDQYYEGHVRNKHPKQSAKFIRESRDLNFVEDVVKDIVAEISQGHGYNVDEIYKIKSNAKENIISDKYLKILLRIGDLLDMSSNRISNAILDNSQSSMSATTRFHWLSHKAISNVDIQVDYELEEDKDEEHSYIGPGSITKKVDFVIYLDIKHLIGIQQKKKCKMHYKMVNHKEDGNKPHFNITVGDTGCCTDCNFMCKWMKVKNEYLYKELEALQLYLNRTESNLFTTHISVRYEFNDGARILSNSEYESIQSYIGGE
ncbi:MAG TPA: hypothetical protein GX707_01110 [Epulopiscium sp.]|nr:hypothetical protein [Candidatus Epulonipiscium sp.]